MFLNERDVLNKWWQEQDYTCDVCMYNFASEGVWGNCFAGTYFCSMEGEIKTLKLKKSSSVGLRNGIYITYNVFTFLLIHWKVRKGVIYRLFSRLVFLFPVHIGGYNATMLLTPNLVFFRFPYPRQKHRLVWEFRILLVKRCGLC